MARLAPFLLLAALVFLTFRRWLSLPLAVLLAAAWMTAAGFGAALGLPTMVALAEVAVWMELHQLTVGAAEAPASPVREAAFAGLVGGFLGGAALWLLTGLPGAPLLLAFAGGTGAAWAGGVGLHEALVACLSLPGKGSRSTFVLGLFLAALVMGLIPLAGGVPGLVASG